MSVNVVVGEGEVRELSEVKGSLELRDGAEVKSPTGVLVVERDVVCEGDVVIKASLKTRRLRAEDGEVVIEGDLEVSRYIRVKDGSLRVEGALKAPEVDVDKRLEVGKDCIVDDLSVGGTVRIYGNYKGKEVNVGGRFYVKGTAEIEALSVGGVAELGDFARVDRVSVGGTFKATKGEFGLPGKEYDKFNQQRGY